VQAIGRSQKESNVGEIVLQKSVKGSATKSPNDSVYRTRFGRTGDM